MLIVRKEQMEAMSAYMLDGFKRRMSEHLAVVLPDRAKALGAEGVSLAVEGGLVRARELGLVSERDVARFIDLEVALAPDDGPGVPAGQIGRLFVDAAKPADERLQHAYDQLPVLAPTLESLAAWWSQSP